MHLYNNSPYFHLFNNFLKIFNVIPSLNLPNRVISKHEQANITNYPATYIHIKFKKYKEAKVHTPARIGNGH